MRKLKKPVIIVGTVLAIGVISTLLYAVFKPKKVVNNSASEEPTTQENTNSSETPEELSSQELQSLYKELFMDRSEASSGIGIIEQKTIKGITYYLSPDNNYIIKEIGNKKYEYVNGSWIDYKTEEITDTGTLTKEDVLSKLGDLSSPATEVSKVEGKTTAGYNDFLAYFYQTYPYAEFSEIRVYTVNNMNLALVVSNDNKVNVFVGKGTYELTKLSLDEYKDIIKQLKIQQ